MTNFLDWMPEQASTFAADVDWINNFISITAFICTLLICGTMLFFAFKYRRRSKQDKTANITHNSTLEFIWTAIPTVVVAFTFYYGFTTYKEMRTPPANPIEVSVEGYQWGWNFFYQTGKKDSKLVVPIDKPIRLVMRSKDVNHSFFIPAMRVKEDVIAGTYHYLWFTPTKLGTYPIFCAEYCGLSHSNMMTNLEVVSLKDFEAYIHKDEKVGLSPVEIGAKLFTDKGCVACHSVDGTPKIGPSLKGIIGRETKLNDGLSLKADENYIKESLMTPSAKIVVGFAPMMPSFNGQLNDKEVDALIAYLKSVK